MIATQPGTFLHYICGKVDRMTPGQRLDVSMSDLRHNIPTFWHNDAHFTPPDRVLGNIVGSAYTHSYRLNLEQDTVTFMRHEETGERYYQDPDRRT